MASDILPVAIVKERLCAATFLNRIAQAEL